MLDYDTCRKLVTLDIYEGEYVKEESIKEDDLVFKTASSYYKVDTKGISKQDLLIAIMTRQAYYTKSIYWLWIILIIISVIAAFIINF